MNSFFQKTLYLLLFAFLMSCQNGNRQILGVWESADKFTKKEAPKLSISQKHGLHWYTSATDSSRYRYNLQSDSLELMNFGGIYNYRLTKLSKKKMVWQSVENSKVLYSFKKKSKHPLEYEKTNAKSLSMKKDIQDLLFALTGPSVELRLKNLLDEFDEGDYLKNPTFYYLTGVSPSKRFDELPEAESHRKLISEIEEIRRVEDYFQLKLEGQENLRTSIPIYKYENGERELQTVLDLFIRKDAVINLKPTVEGIKIDIDGVRVGKGWLKIGLPTLRISGNYGSLLGFRCKLSR
jgi:hypothetical protein